MCVDLSKESEVVWRGAVRVRYRVVHLGDKVHPGVDGGAVEHELRPGDSHRRAEADHDKRLKRKKKTLLLKLLNHSQNTLNTTQHKLHASFLHTSLFPCTCI
jgi:hypothetical protein